MKNIFIIIAVLFLGSSLTYCSEKQDTGVLELVIVTEEIRISHIKDSKRGPCIKSCADIKYQLVNKSKVNTLLYNFKRFMRLGYYHQELSCDTPKVKNRKALFILTDSMTFVRPGMHIPDSLEGNPEAFAKQYKMKKEWYRNSRVTVKGGEVIEFSENIDFRDFNLVPGVYYLKLLYHQSKVSSDMKPEEVEADLKENNAYLFNGCLLSNAIKLIVD